MPGSSPKRSSGSSLRRPRAFRVPKVRGRPRNCSTSAQRWNVLLELHRFRGPVDGVRLAGPPGPVCRGGQKGPLDAEKMECTNMPELNKLLRREYRKGLGGSLSHTPSDSEAPFGRVARSSRSDGRGESREDSAMPLTPRTVGPYVSAIHHALSGTCHPIRYLALAVSIVETDSARLVPSAPR